MNIPSPSNINRTVLSDHPRCRSGAQQKNWKHTIFCWLILWGIFQFLLNQYRLRQPGHFTYSQLMHSNWRIEWCYTNITHRWLYICHTLVTVTWPFQRTSLFSWMSRQYVSCLWPNWINCTQSCLSLLWLREERSINSISCYCLWINIV